MKINKKDCRLAFAKSINADARSAEAYISTFEWDRTDEKFAKGAWNLDAFKANPVVMWAHDYHRPPIGKAVNIKEDDKGLLADTQFAGDEFSQMIFDMFKGGFLSAFSVGFNPKNFIVEPIDADRKGIVYTEADLLEYSAVPIPANPGALVTNEMAKIVTKALGPAALFKMKVDGEEKFMVAPPMDIAVIQTPDLEASLKYVIDLAKSAGTVKLAHTQIKLLTSAVSIFQEILDENQEGVDQDTVSKLGEVVRSYSGVIENLFPDASLTVRRAMTQIDKAIRGTTA
jgi:HK97 family phage prohead protease